MRHRFRSISIQCSPTDLEYIKRSIEHFRLIRVYGLNYDGEKAIVMLDVDGLSPTEVALHCEVIEREMHKVVSLHRAPEG